MEDDVQMIERFHLSRETIEIIRYWGDKSVKG